MSDDDDDDQRQTKTESPAQSLLARCMRVRLGRRQQQQLVGVEEGDSPTNDDGGDEAPLAARALALAITESVTVVFRSLQGRPSEGQTRLSLRPDGSAQRSSASAKRDGGRKRARWRGTREALLVSSPSTFFFSFRISLSTSTLSLSLLLNGLRRPLSLPPKHLITHRVPVGVQVRHVDRGVPVVVCRELEREGVVRAVEEEQEEEEEEERERERKRRACCCCSANASTTTTKPLKKR